MNEERPDVIIKREHLQKLDDTLAIAEYGCHVFMKFLFFHSLHGSPAFLGETSTDLQIDPLYRLSDVCRKNDYRPVWKNITQHYDL